jgi:hypothetical protein
MGIVPHLILDIDMVTVEAQRETGLWAGSISAL